MRAPRIGVASLATVSLRLPMHRSHSSGFTIVQLTIACALGGLLIALMLPSFKSATLFTARAEQASDTSSELARLLATITRLGRLAQSCQLVSGELNCRVDFTFPPTAAAANDTQVRFRQATPTTVVEERQPASAGAWSVADTFTGIAVLEVCDDARMTAGTCPIPQTAISLRHKDNLTHTPNATPAGRFFRFRLGAKRNPKTDAVSYVQSSFFVRHPTSVANLVWPVASGD